MKAPEQYYGTGKRKTSIARVYLRPGNGQILINKKSLDDYFGQEAHRVLVRQPLVLTENSERFNVLVNVRGAVLPARPEPSGTDCPAPCRYCQ